MLHPFDYYSPKSLDEAFEKIKKHEDSLLLAGGTDLLVNLRSGKVRTGTVIDVKHIHSLKSIVKTENGIEIGALATMNELAHSPVLSGPYALLAQAASLMGCYEIRNRATIGGNIINASPGAETLCPLTVLEARVLLKSESGKRVLALTEFLKGPNKTDIVKGEILTSVILPVLPEESRGIYMRRQRAKGMDLASVNCALLALYPQDIVRREIRMAFGTVAPVPFRPIELEKSLKGRKIDSKTIKETVSKINSMIKPRATSLRATPEYKKIMVEVFLERGLKKI
ncbi:MAG TPA: xanthine dehydrogenase family protein subunit M, partial [bacterium]|nr:xanthine dehydrogenase family protein subunit M [bacterium]